MMSNTNMNNQQIPTFDQYLEYRQRFAVSRELALSTLEWAEPLARHTLGAHANRDQMNMGDRLHYIPLMTSASNNGGWGELMPVWFKPYERPLPIFILDNWAMFALLWQHWLDDVGPAFNVENVLKIFLGGDLLIPFLPQVQEGGHFLRNGAFPILQAIRWLEPEVRDTFMASIRHGAQRFAEAYKLREQADLGEYMGLLEFVAFFSTEGHKIGEEEKIRAFLANETQFNTYAALFGGLCFTLAALDDWYGPNWEKRLFHNVNVEYRFANFGLEAWAKWLEV